MNKNRVIELGKNGTLCLITLYLLLGILIVSHSFYQVKQRELNVLTRGLYEKDALSFEVRKDSPAIDWGLLHTSQSFAIFNELPRHIESSTKSGKKLYYDVRAIYYQKSTYQPPMIEGRFFREDDFYRDKKLAVVGRKVAQNEIRYVQQNGKAYYVCGGDMFEVIGVMGAPYISQIDHLVLLNLDAVMPPLSSIYVMNSSDRSVVDREKLSFKDRTIPTSIRDREDVGAQRFIDKDAYENIVLPIMLFVILIFHFVFTTYWMDKKRSELQILWRLGIPVKQAYRRYLITYFTTMSACYLAVCTASYFLMWYLASIPNLWLIHLVHIGTRLGILLLFAIFFVWISFRKATNQIEGSVG